MKCVTDFRPLWICFFVKGKEKFVLKFNQMLLACMRARAIGYSIKTFSAK